MLLIRCWGYSETPLFRFLPSRVPNLELDGLSINVNSSNLEVDTNSWHEIVIENIILNNQINKLDFYSITYSKYTYGKSRDGSSRRAPSSSSVASFRPLLPSPSLPSLLLVLVCLLPTVSDIFSLWPKGQMRSLELNSEVDFGA